MHRKRTHHERAIRVFQSRVRGQNRVVRLNNGVRHLRRRVNAEFEFRLLAIVGGQALEKESTETRTSSTTERVEHEEALQTGTVIGEPTNLVHDKVDLLLADSVVATCICNDGQHATRISGTGKELTVVRGILLASDKSLRVEETPVRTRPHLIDHIRLQIYVERAWHMLA